MAESTVKRQQNDRPEKAPPVSRRDVLKRAACLGGFTIVPRYVLGGPGHTAASELLNIALIGAGGRGKNLIEGLLRYDDVRIAAIADVNEKEDYSDFYYRDVAGRRPVLEMVNKHYAEQQDRGEYPGCKEYVDYRKMLEREKGIDAVVIATPDHVHAVAIIHALRLGKHVYCEKPLTHTIAEARKVADEARKAKVATQMGNQGNSDEGHWLAAEWIRAGVIGEVRRVYAWTKAGSWAPDFRGRPTEHPPVPKGLEWDLWLGPVKPRPYHPAYAPFKWRGWWAFGNGAVGDMGCHNMDPAFRALELNHPLAVEAYSPTEGRNEETVSLASIIHYDFPARGKMPPLKLSWYDGGLYPPRPDEFHPDQKHDSNGCLFVGTKGKLLMDGWSRNPRLLPKERMDSFERPPETFPRPTAHDRAWLDACKGGPAASSNFEYAARLTELALLGGIALRVPEKIRWDGPAMRVTNSPAANELLRSDYRDGWEI